MVSSSDDDESTENNILQSEIDSCPDAQTVSNMDPSDSDSDNEGSSSSSRSLADHW